MPRRRERPLLTFVIDSREQAPYELAAPDPRKFDDGAQYGDGLDTGDYTCEVNGQRVDIRVERKSLGDYFAVVGRERERFNDELGRLAGHRWAYVIIEATADQIRIGFERSQVSGLAAWKSALHWSVATGVQFVFAGNRRMGRQVAQALLEEAAWHTWREKGATDDAGETGRGEQ